MGSNCSCSVKETPKYHKLLELQRPVISESNSTNHSPNEKHCILAWKKKLSRYIKYKHPLKQFLKHSPLKFKKLLMKGPPCGFRWEVWKTVLNYKNNPSAYSSAGSSTTCSEHSFSIEKDIDRTFPSHPYFGPQAEGASALKSILKRFASTYPTVGYCQGMNYVVGILLMVSGGDESESFGVLEILCTQFGLSGLYEHGFPLVTKLCSVFHQELAKHLPELEQYFLENDFDDNFWLIKWFITLFSYSLKISDVVKVWDSIIANGISYLVNVSLAVVSYFKNQILSSTLHETLELLVDMKASQINIKQVMKVAARFKQATVCSEAQNTSETCLT